jgi:formiminotetrahydrofolate cyclodeaminase
MGAQLNVQINTSSMKNRACAEELNARAARMMESGVRKADLVYQRVEKRIAG